MDEKPLKQIKKDCILIGFLIGFLIGVGFSVLYVYRQYGFLIR